MTEGSGPEVALRQTIKSAAAFRTISEVSAELNIPQHVLRFWETRFAQVKPLKRAGGRRYYRPEDVALLRRIRDLLYIDGYTIRGVQRLLKESGVRAVIDGSAGTVAPPERRRTGSQAAQHASLDAKRPELEAILSELKDLRSLFDRQR
jgi:DNA-binding transcriptional MerR regulator